MIDQLVTTVRAAEWWEHKLPPILGSGYATGFLLGTSLLHLWPAFLLALLAVIPGAAYVSLVNDLTDLRVDRAAGKVNRLAGRSPAYAVLAIAACLAAGWTIAILAWGGDGAALAVYACAWIAFSLYSIPPVRLKDRGLPGALADAMGAHLFPQLLMVLAVFNQQGSRVLTWWVALVGGWALLYGVRGAVYHQLKDVRADQEAGVRTFGRLHPQLARLLTTYLLFPCEVGLFCAMLVRAHNALAVALLPVYLLLELLRARAWGVSLIVVSRPPHDNYSVAMHEYYVALYPLAFLIAAAVRHPPDAVLIVAHVALFPRVPAAMARDLIAAVRDLHAARSKLVS